MAKTLDEIFKDKKTPSSQNKSSDKSSLDSIFKSNQPITSNALPVEPQAQSGGFMQRNAGVIGTTAAVGVPLAVGAVKVASDYWQGPNKQLKPINQQFEQWRQQSPDLRGKMDVDIPKVLSNRVRDIGDQIKDFDETILNTKSANLAEEIASTYPQFKQANYAKYADALNLAESEVVQSGMKMNNRSFNENVIQKTINSLEFKMPESEFSRLKKMVEKESAILDASGKKMKLTTELPFSTVKKFKDSIASKLPPDAQRELNSNWGKYMEQHGVKSLQPANQKYQTFLQQDASLRKMVDPKTGQFDYSKLNSHIEKRVKTGINSDFKKLMSAFGEEVPSVKGKATDIYTQRMKRIDLKRTARSLGQWARKAEELLMDKEAIMEKAPIRTGGVGRAVKGALGLARNAGRIMRPLGIGLQALDAMNQGALIDKARRGTPIGVNPWGQLVDIKPEDMMA